MYMWGDICHILLLQILWFRLKYSIFVALFTKSVRSFQILPPKWKIAIWRWQTPQLTKPEKAQTQNHNTGKILVNPGLVWMFDQIHKKIKKRQSPSPCMLNLAYQAVNPLRLLLITFDPLHWPNVITFTGFRITSPRKWLLIMRD